MRALQAGAASYVPKRHVGPRFAGHAPQSAVGFLPAAQPAAADGLHDP